ncbi:hypothetical protein pb186bvf_003761 [Paramecium bursaria]
MNVLDQVAGIIKLNGIDTYEPALRITSSIKPDLKPSHIGTIFLGFTFIMCTLDVASRSLINSVGLIIPCFRTLQKMTNGQPLLDELPYFLIYAPFIVFHGWYGLLFGWLPLYQVWYLLLVIALQHPTINGAQIIWNLIESHV